VRYSYPQHGREPDPRELPSEGRCVPHALDQRLPDAEEAKAIYTQRASTIECL
jgi:hypothetical protein